MQQNQCNMKSKWTLFPTQNALMPKRIKIARYEQQGWIDNFQLITIPAQIEAEKPVIFV